MPTILENKIAEFNSRYGTKLTVAKLDNSAQRKLKNVDNIFSGRKTQNSPLKNYLSLLVQTLADAIREKLQINDNADYDASRVDILAFINAFESIMKARQEETEYDRKREAYEGADYKKLVKYVVDSTKEFDQALCWNWAEDVVNDKLSYEDLKAVTDRAIASLDNLPNGAEFGDNELRKLANVYWAMKAMEMVRQQRGFFFAIFSFRINRREKAYFNQLVEAKNRYQSKGYPVGELQSQGYVSVMKESYEDVEKGLVAQEEYKKIEKRRAEEIRNIPKVVDMATPRLQDPAFKEKISQEIVQQLPKCRFDKPTQKAMMDAMLMNNVLNAVNNANKEFDEGVAQGESVQDLMAYSVKVVFQAAYLYTASLGYMEIYKQLAAAQVITDVIMKNYSAVLLDEKKYEYYTDGYMFKNSLECEELLDLSNYTDQIDKGRTLYQDTKREAVEIVNLDNRAQEQIVPPVENVPKVRVPVVNKN